MSDNPEDYENEHASLREVADGEQVIASTLGQVGMSHGTFIKERDVSRALFDMRLSHMSPGDFDDWDDFDDPDDGYF